MARPRAFDTDEALAAITEIFCEKGYEGASLSDLVAATGLKKGSLYAAFGDKRRMYHAALALYDRRQIGAAIARMREPGSGADRIARLLATALDGTRAEGAGRGCFLCSAASDQGATDAATAEALAKSTARLEAAIFDALADTGVGRDATARRRKARELLALYFGLRVLSRMALPAATREDAAAAGLEGLR